MAGGLIVLEVLTWALPSGAPQEDIVASSEKARRGLEKRVAALEEILKHFSREDNEVFITGANLHIVNGLGRTDCGFDDEPIPNCPNGLGNLIVGYNEPRGFEGEDSEDPNMRTGSHNVVVGSFHNFSHFGDWSSVSSTTLAGRSPPSVEALRARPAGSLPRSVRARGIPLAARSLPSAVGTSTRLAGSFPQSAAGATERQKGTSTGWPLGGGLG